MSNQSAIDSMVFESFMKGAETVILERKAILQPMTTSSSSDCAEYIRQTVNSWKRQLSRPMNIDLYIFNNATNGHVLMERWNFTYTNSPDSSELGSTATINQRIQTLLRGLYSFLRLLPGFNLLRCSPVKPLITVQIYDPKISPEAFRYESSNYNFPTISTSKGQLSLSVAFTNPAIVKDILRTINGGSLVGLPHSSSTRPEKGDSRVHSASIPIPGRTPPQDPYRARVFSDSKENQPRRSFKDESGLTAALRGEVRAMEARGEPTGVYMSPAPGTSGPSRQGGMLHPGSFGSGGDILFGTSPSSFSGRGLFYPQASSLPTASSFQQGSTPPAFGYMTNYDGGSSNSFDLPRPSPPYYPISSSLNSTSPHLGPSQLTTIMDRRQSWRKSSNSATLTQLSTSHRTEVLMAAVEQEVSRMKVSLPPSPFLALSSSSSSSSKPSTGTGSGSDSSKVQTTAENASQSGKAGGSSAAVTTMNIGDIESIENLPSIPATLPSRNSNNRLDIVMKYEKERERRNSEVYLYDSYPDSRSISISETTRDRDEDPLDAVLDDDAPFATYRPSFSSGNAVTPMYSVTAMTSASAAAVAPILAILNRGSTQKPGYSSGGLLGGTVDGLGGSGIPLPILTQELQRSVQDHKAFWQQYVASRNISLPSSAAPSVKAK